MAPPRTSVRQRLLERHIKDGDCWIWSGSKTSDGYGVIGVGRGKQVRAHKASYETFVGNIPPGMLVCHSCDNPACIHHEHLFLGTPKDNTKDMYEKGRASPPLRGEAHPTAKLTDSQVDTIRNRRKSGEQLKNIARDYGISFQHVSALSIGTYRANTKF